jgi:hypothetical protein
MHMRRAIGTLALAAGLFVGLALPALAGGEMGASDMAPAGSAPAAQMPAGKDGGPMPSSASPAGGSPAGQAPSSVVSAPARAGGLDPATAGAALSGLGMLVLGGGVAVRRRSA